MSLSDLELLQLVDTVKAKQRGPKGEPGVGISEIEQFDETGFTIRLTDGSFKRVNLPAPKDGVVGPVGPAGPVGESGSAGRPGRDGVQGPAGRDGADGLPGSFVETSVVNSDGHLLLGISDGSIIDVGRVVGPAGATGPVGATGLAGESGKDGAAVLSGPRAPQADDGVEGDHWIDISSAEFSFFKKNGDGWQKLANLRQPARDPRVGPVAGGGGSTGGGGGSAKGYTTSNLPMTGLGRSVKNASDGKAGGINKPGGNIIPKANDLKFQSNFNRWAVESLDALDAALPIAKVDDLPDEGKYEGDMVLHDGSLHVWIDGAWVAIGGGTSPDLGKENKPWIQINSWGMRRSPYGNGPKYEVSWTCNPNAMYSWQYEIDVNGDGDWIDIADHPQKDDLGFSPSSEFPNVLTLANTKQEERYPNALMRFRIGAELNELNSDLKTAVIGAWEEIHDEYDPPLYEDGTSVNLDAYATENYVDEKVVSAAAQVQTQADWTNQVYSSGVWLLQTGDADKPEIQRFILSNEAHEDTAEFADVKYISVHALGGGEFVNYKLEKVGDTIQVYNNPLSGDQKASFGIYEIEEIDDRNFPDDPDADGTDFSDAFIAYTVKPLAYQGVVEPNEICQIKTMPPVVAAGDGSETHVGENPPADAKVGDLWYCSKPDDLTLYVLAEAPDVWAAAAPPVSLDGVAGDIQNIDAAVATVRADLFEVDNDLKQSQSDLKALTEAVDEGVREQTQLRSRIGDCEYLAGNALPKSGGQMTGDLAFKATGKDEYWSYIRALRPSSWSTTENTHGLILDIGDTNSYKQQFKITGRGGRELFKLNDDGSASATLKGRLNVTEKLSVNGDKVLTQSDLPEQDLFWKWVPDPTNTVQERHIYWLEKQAGDFQFNISTVAQNGVIDIPDFETVNVSHPFSIYTKDADGIKMIAIGTLKNIAVNSTSSSLMQYLDVRVAKTDMVLWRPSYIAKEAPVICKIGGFIP